MLLAGGVRVFFEIQALQLYLNPNFCQSLNIDSGEILTHRYMTGTLFTAGHFASRFADGLSGDWYEQYPFEFTAN